MTNCSAFLTAIVVGDKGLDKGILENIAIAARFWRTSRYTDRRSAGISHDRLAATWTALGSSRLSRLP